MNIRSIQPILLGILCLIALAYMATLTRLNLRHFEQTVTSQTERYLTTIAKTQARHLEDLMGKIQTELEVAASNPTVRQSFLERTPESRIAEDGRYPLRDVQRRLNHIVSSIYRIDENGNVLGRTPPRNEIEEQNTSSREDVQAALCRETPTISNVFTTVSGTQAISVSTPVRQGARRLGLLRAVIHLETLNTLVGHIRAGVNGFAWMVDQYGDLICFPDESLLGRSVFAYRLRWFCDQRQEDQVLASLLEGNSGTASFVSDRKKGDKTMMAWSPVNLGDRHWSIAVCMNYDEQISGPLRHHAQNTFIMMGCFLAAMAMGGAMYFRFERKKSHLQAHLALGRVNDELQLLSFERAQTEQELQTQVRQLKSVIEAIPYGVCWKDRKGVYCGANSAFANLVGEAHPDAIRGKTETELARDGTIAERSNHGDQEVLKTGIGLLNVEQRQTIQGKKATLLVSKAPLTDARGGVVGLLGIYVDITDIKRVYSNKETEWKRWNEVLNRVGVGIVLADASGIVQEINAGAADAVGQSRSELIGRSLTEMIPPAYRKGVAGSFDALREERSPGANRLRIPVGDREMEACLGGLMKQGALTGFWMTLVDVTEYARGQERAEYASYRTGRYLASMSYQIRTAMNSVLGFAELLLQEELNGRQNEHVRQITENASHLLGIADELVNLSRVETGEDAKTTPLAGTPIVSSEQKEIPPESAKTEAKSEAPASQETMESIATGSEPRILVVDDVPENRTLLEVILKKAGYRVLSAMDGQAAINLAAKQVFDMILMDMQMPIVNGFEATRRIRTEGLNTKTVILAMTASVEKGQELQCLDAGCDDFVTKPLKKELLLRKIWRYLEQNKQLAAAGRGEPILSFLAGDPDYQKTIEMFVNNLPSRLQEMQQAFDDGNLKELAVKVHALKGLGGFAGFPVFTEKAKVLEGTIQGRDLAKIRFELDEMADLCRRTKIETK